MIYVMLDIHDIAMKAGGPGAGSSRAIERKN